MGCAAVHPLPDPNPRRPSTAEAHVVRVLPEKEALFATQHKYWRQNALYAEFALLRHLNERLRAAVAEREGSDAPQWAIASVDDRTVLLATQCETHLAVRRRHMVKVVDTLSERIAHAIHTSDALTAMESATKEFVNDAVGDVVATGEVRLDWSAYPPRSLGAAIRDYFCFPSGYLDSLSFGSCPKPILEAKAQWDVLAQRDPALWRFRSLMLRLNEMRSRLAVHAKLDPSDVVFVVNTATGVSTILKGQPWRPGDKLMLLSTEFSRTKAAAQSVAQQFGIEIIEVAIPLPCTNSNIVSALKDHLVSCHHGRPKRAASPIKLACVPHVTPEGWTLPAKKLCKLLHDYGIATVVDGTLAFGQFDFHIGAIDADYYVASLDRWLFAPKGCGFIVVAPLKQPAIFPLTVSYFAGQGYEKEFSYTGLQDFAPFLALRQSFEFINHVCGGLARLQSECTSLASAMVRVLESMWNVRVCQYLPRRLHNCYYRLPVIPVPRGTGQPPDAAERLTYHLATHHRLMVRCLIAHYGAPTLCVRLSVQIFNEVQEAKALGGAVLALNGNYAALPPVPAHVAPLIAQLME